MNIIGSKYSCISGNIKIGQLSIIDDEGMMMLSRIMQHSDAIKNEYDQLETNKCMRIIMECADIANKYIDEKAPWALVKEDRRQAQVVCTVSLNALRILMIYLSPVLPCIIKKLAQFLTIRLQTWDQQQDHLINVKILQFSIIHLCGGILDHF